MLCFRRFATTGRKRSSDSAIEQLMFFFENASDAAPKTATSVGARGARGLEALQVRRQHRIGDAGLAADALQHLGVVGHLRDPLRRDERRRLDRRQAGVREPLDQLDLHRGRHLARLVLQAVARADLDDADRRHSSVTSSAPSSTCSPAA